MDKKKVGRPKKIGERKKIQLTVTQQEFDKIEALALAEEKAIATFAKELIFKNI